MRRVSDGKVRGVLDERRSRIRPGVVVLGSVAAILGGLIVWNAFFGQHQRFDAELLAEVPPGATTRLKVSVPGKSSRTITLKYDTRVEALQRELLATGHYRGLVDGVIGNRTVEAIKKYQSENQLPVTGEVTAPLLDHIRYTRKIAAASDFTGSIDAIAQSPDETSRTSITQVQRRLAQLGYDLDEFTGAVDDATRSAILQFEMDRGLAMEGKITAALLRELRKAGTAAELDLQ